MQPTTLEEAEAISPLPVVKPLSPAIDGSGGCGCRCVGLGAAQAAERGAMRAAAKVEPWAANVRPKKYGPHPFQLRCRDFILSPSSVGTTNGKHDDA